MLPGAWLAIGRLRAGNRVVSADMPGMATGKPFDREIQPPDSATSIDSFNCILRTSRRIAATVTEIGAQQVLIGANRECQEFLHCLITLFQCFSRLMFSSGPAIDKIGRPTIITISLAGKRCWFFLKLSLITLLILFLCAALWICFLAIANPSLGYAPEQPRTSIVIQASPTRKLLLNTCR